MKLRMGNYFCEWAIWHSISFLFIGIDSLHDSKLFVIYIYFTLSRYQKSFFIIINLFLINKKIRIYYSFNKFKGKKIFLSFTFTTS